MYEAHGMSGTPEYRSWSCMLSRCHNPSYDGYHNYGGRGIEVCAEWRHSFSAFFRDVGFRPFPKAQLDRVANDKGYYKSNCQWATNRCNSQNTRRTVLNWNKVRNIRKLYSTGDWTHRSLAQEFGTSKSNVGAILNNQKWVVND